MCETGSGVSGLCARPSAFPSQSVSILLFAAFCHGASAETNLISAGVSNGPPTEDSVGAAPQGFVSQPAGFVRLELPADSRTLVALPFEPFDPRLCALFSNQPADAIIQWDKEGQRYLISSRGEGSAWYDADGILSTQTLKLGEGFWIENRQSEQGVFLVGKVPLGGHEHLAFVQGLNVFGYPYPSPKALNEAGLPSEQGDVVRDGAGRGYQPGPEGLWNSETGVAADLFLTPGSGWWYERGGTNGFWWSPARPYDDVFRTGTNAPEIEDIRASPDQEAVALSISCGGAADEVLEIFYTDLERHLAASART